MDLNNEGKTLIDSVKRLPSSTEAIVETYSEALEEIVSSKPGHLIRFGNLIIYAILAILTATCWIVRYPDLIRTTAKLTAINAPKPVISYGIGKIVKLFVVENQTVKKGDILGYLESNGDPEEILKLKMNLDTMQILLDCGKINVLRNYLRQTNTSYGELQIAYQSFRQNFLTFESCMATGFYQRKKQMLLIEHDNLFKLNNNLIVQKKLKEEDVDLFQKTFNANEFLRNDSVISEFDYRTEKSKLIAKKLSIPELNTAIITNESQQTEKEMEIVDVENIIDQNKVIFQQALNTFQNQLDEWRKKFLLVAPIDGRVTFPRFLQENQHIQLNEIVCYVNPPNSNFFAEMVIPQYNFGKVIVGQTVLLKFQSYNSNEYGVVHGRIIFISDIPSEGGYLAKVILPNGLKTTYSKEIQYREGLIANAEIVTKNMRLLERFYYSTYSIFR